jgi:hypothetical protein
MLSEWVNDYFLVRSQQCFQLYHGENKLHFNEIMMFSAQYSVDKHARWNFIVLVRWSNSPRVDLLFHSDTVFWFPANYSLNTELVAEHTNFIVFGLTRAGIEVTTYRTWGEYTNHYTTDMVSFMLSPILLAHCCCVEKAIRSTPIPQLVLPPSSTSNRR